MRDLKVALALSLPEAYPEALAEIARAAYEHLVDVMAVGHADANEAALAIAEAARREFGGQRIYFPKGHHMQLSARDREIYAKYNGRNMQQLQAEYHLTEVRLRSIIARVHADELKRRQPTLI